MKSVPMNTSRLISKAIVNVHNYTIAQVYIDLRARPLAIDANSGPDKPIRSNRNPSDVPVVNDSLSKSKLAEAEKKDCEQLHACDKKNAGTVRGFFVLYLCKILWWETYLNMDSTPS
jgi:hypothetical protein